MRTIVRLSAAVGLMAVGYFCGSVGVFSPGAADAQIPEGSAPSVETIERIKASVDALRQAASQLRQDNRYRLATKGLNSFAITAGGVDAIADLESGRGVDPETFAGLYAGMALPEVSDQLDKDEQGRLTYKGRVVRMYPISRLQQMFQQRIEFAGSE